MENEDSGRDQEHEDFDRVAGGKRKTERNPKGAGRPTKLEARYRKFLEFEKLEAAGFSTRDVPDIIRGMARDWQRGGEGDTQRKPKRFMGSILEGLGWKEKAIKEMKVDVADEQIDAVVSYALPYAMPYLIAVPSAAIGVGVLWWAENRTVTEKFTKKEYDKLTDAQKAKYLDWLKPLEAKGGTRTVTDEDGNEVSYTRPSIDVSKVKDVHYYGTRYRLPIRPVHAYIKYMKFMFGILEELKEAIYEWRS